MGECHGTRECVGVKMGVSGKQRYIRAEKRHANAAARWAAAAGAAHRTHIGDRRANERDGELAKHDERLPRHDGPGAIRCVAVVQKAEARAHVRCGVLGLVAPRANAARPRPRANACLGVGSAVADERCFERRRDDDGDWDADGVHRSANAREEDEGDVSALVAHDGEVGEEVALPADGCRAVEDRRD